MPKPWSKHTKGSSAYQITHGREEKGDKKKDTEEDKEAQKERERKKDRFRAFLTAMGVQKGEKNQSWNDSFTAFMADTGSGLLETSKKEEKKEEEKKEEKE